MTAFTFSPYVGPLPLHFGMTRREVKTILGPPDETVDDETGLLVERRLNVNVGYSASDGRLKEVVFTPDAELHYQGHNLFHVDDLIGFLRKTDPKPQLFVGDVIFCELGIGLSGFHNNDESQKAISLYSRGDLDDFIDDFVPFT